MARSFFPSNASTLFVSWPRQNSPLRKRDDTIEEQSKHSGGRSTHNGGQAKKRCGTQAEQQPRWVGNMGKIDDAKDDHMWTMMGDITAEERAEDETRVGGGATVFTLSLPLPILSYTHSDFIIIDYVEQIIDFHNNIGGDLT
ncbi:hypothetical protein SESBI_02494 [Sesbania bispinosa]|nr:hypothetical protein SESBI_02494 [Sesbania bispinosa]